MKSIKTKMSKRYNENANSNDNPCIICGKECKPGSQMLWAHGGSLEMVVTFEYGTELNKTDPGADMGCWPIGPDCLKKNPQLKPFIITEAK